MAAPIELAPAQAACCEHVAHSCTQDALGQKLKQALCKLQASIPDRFVRVEIWRLMVLQEGSEFGDERVEAWVRIAENVSAALFERRERWFQQEVGLLEQTDTRLLIPQWYSVEVADEILLPHSEALYVTRRMNEGGVVRLSGDKAKARFVRPNRTDRTYRIAAAGARII